MTGFVVRMNEELDYLGLRRADLCRGTGISEGTVRSWITRDSIPPADVALEVANYLHVSLEYLLTGEDRKPQVLNKFSTEEENLVYDFRILTEVEKTAVRTLIDTFKKSNTSQVQTS